VARAAPAEPAPPGRGARYALRYQGRKRVHNADEIMAEIVAERLVEHLERAGFVVMKRPPEIGPRGAGAGIRGSLKRKSAPHVDSARHWCERPSIALLPASR
jgi:hypothetical protein